MPEPPDVEIFKQRLDATALHQRIAEVGVEAIEVSGWSGRYCPRYQKLP